MRYLISFFLLITTVSCVTLSVTRISGKTYPVTDPYEVVLYFDEDEIKGEFERIAIIHAKGDQNFTDENKMYDTARKKAAELGANGLLIEKVKDASAGEQFVGALTGWGGDRKGKMYAIYVLSPNEVSPAKTPPGSD